MSLLSRVTGRLPHLPIPGVTWAARRWMASSFGPSALDPTADDGDVGLLGPGSASWQLFADAASIPGGIRSLLVQLTHPLAMAGVAEHSRYLADPLGRLRHTAAHVALTTYGSTAEALDSVGRVRAVHRRVHGTLADGRTYDAEAPELLAWVGIAGTVSWLRTDADLAVRPLDAGQRDAFVAEQALVNALLDPRVDLRALRARPDPAAALHAGEVALPLVEEGWLPTTEADLQAKLEWFAPRLSVGTHGREALEFLLWPPIDPALRLGYLPTLAAAIGSLDPLTAQLLGLPRQPLVAAGLRVQGEAALVALRAALARPSPNVARAQRRAGAVTSAQRLGA